MRSRPLPKAASKKRIAVVDRNPRGRRQSEQDFFVYFVVFCGGSLEKSVKKKAGNYIHALCFVGSVARVS